MKVKSKGYKVLIVDDEEFVHDVLNLSLQDIHYEGNKVQYIHAYNSEEARTIIEHQPDIAVIILDIMMEYDDAGLHFVSYLRDDLQNKTIKILLHTGQIKVAPKKQVTEHYLIDGYLDKNAVHNEDCYVAVKLALRAYHEHLKMVDGLRPTNTDLLLQIMETYSDLLAHYTYSEHYEILLAKINKISYLTQELLFSYTLSDLKHNLPIGTTKSQQLSAQDYLALVSIGNIKLICLDAIKSDEKIAEQEMLYLTLNRAAKQFSKISILPAKAKDMFSGFSLNKENI